MRRSRARRSAAPPSAPLARRPRTARPAVSLDCAAASDVGSGQWRPTVCRSLERTPHGMSSDAAAGSDVEWHWRRHGGVGGIARKGSVLHRALRRVVLPLRATSFICAHTHTARAASRGACLSGLCVRCLSRHDYLRDASSLCLALSEPAADARPLQTSLLPCRATRRLPA
jgi:hypothetical protein